MNDVNERVEPVKFAVILPLLPLSYDAIILSLILQYSFSLWSKAGEIANYLLMGPTVILNNAWPLTDSLISGFRRPFLPGHSRFRPGHSSFQISATTASHRQLHQTRRRETLGSEAKFCQQTRRTIPKHIFKVQGKFVHFGLDKNRFI